MYIMLILVYRMLFVLYSVAMNPPLGFLLTWHTYASWLPGDARGTVDRHHNRFEVPTLPPAPRRHAAALAACRTSPIRLDSAKREAVEASIIERCRFARWNLHAVAVRSNHVHVVVGFADMPPERMMNSLKSWSTRALRRRKLIESDISPWVRHGSTRYLWDSKSLEGAIRYVREGQDVPR